MPGYKKHSIGALFFWAISLSIIVIIQSVTVCQALEWGMLTLFGGLFPDIDTKSKIQRWVYSALLMGGFLLFVCNRHSMLTVILLLALIPLIVKHRSLMHSFSFLVGATCCITLMAITYFPAYKQLFIFDAFFFVIGIISHLILDRQGIFFSLNKYLRKNKFFKKIINS